MTMGYNFYDHVYDYIGMTMLTTIKNIVWQFTRVFLVICVSISCSARLIYKAKSAHITPLLYSLHWLPSSSRI